MMGTKARAFAPLCNRSIEDLVSANNFYRHLEAKLDLSFVRELVRSTYKECGRPSVDPRVLFKLQRNRLVAKKPEGDEKLPIEGPAARLGGALVKDAKDQPTRMVGTVQDITDQFNRLA